MSKESPIGSTPRIRKLEPIVVAKIAAGEMILRPVSAAKELLENALDAGATRIEVKIQETADRFLSVSDNGCGMSEEECMLAIERHATSKIVEEGDLEAVETLGFRGEALPSIARVARLRLLTSTDGSQGWEVRIRGGNVEAARPAGRAKGTTVEVEDLFFNSPVRKRFLRSPAGEVRLIQRILAAYALPRPEIDFRMTVDERETLRWVPTDPEGRLEQIHGARFREKVLPLHGQNPRIRITGWVGIPEIARSSTQGQTVLVNGRWVSHPPLAHALRRGFGDLIAPTKHPFALLALDVVGGSVDVNIHPTKREIRFVDERLVFAEVVRVVREATVRLVPGLSSREDRWGASHSRSADLETTPIGTPAGSRKNDAKQSDLEGLDLLYRPQEGGEAPKRNDLGIVRDGPWPDSDRSRGEIPPVQLWQIHERYIVAQTRQGLLIVDQHAAHERILYERALRCLEGDQPTSQQLLFPVVVPLTDGEQDLVERIAGDLTNLGIHLEPFGEKEIILRAVPATWEGDPTTMLRELLDDVSERTRRSEERTQALAASYACHSAIRSGQKLDLESMNRVIDELFSTQLPHGDPHGRPTYVFLSVEELDRRFGRSG